MATNKHISYGSFAMYYDILTAAAGIDYQLRGEYFRSLLERYGKTDGILLDLGCGTGSLCEVMAGFGYDVIGVDNSADMLNTAMDKRYNSGLDITFICQDMTALDLYGTMDVCISALDSLNHITDEGKLKRVFERVSLFLHPDGIFIFDVNTPHKHRNVLCNNTFIYDCDEVYCAWQNTLLADDVVEISLDLFAPDEDGRYHRMSEMFCEKAYDDVVITRLLEATDMEIVARFAGDTTNARTDTTERMVYVVKSCKAKCRHD